MSLPSAASDNKRTLLFFREECGCGGNDSGPLSHWQIPPVILEGIMSTRKHGFQMRPDNPPFPDDRPRQRSGDVVDLEPDKLVMRLASNEGATARFLRFLHFPECFVRLWPIAQYEISKGINLIP